MQKIILPPDPIKKIVLIVHSYGIVFTSKRFTLRVGKRPRLQVTKFGVG